ncbi:MAG TPA: alpha/beta hydrolase [Pseudorhodoplanes sp.]|nr:alpha/beta hydrolase [Pseudorhodoplanes sp.]
MTDLADLFPGFASHWVDTSIGRIFARSGGEGPPLLLLHGYPQTNVMWHRVAPALARHYTLVIPDLPGYGWSVAPEAAKDHAPYDKRSMGNVMVEVMEKLGHVRFHLAGHDRGGRVAYRMAFDHPGRLVKLATLDIIPTYEMWHRMDHMLAVKVWHWVAMAQKYPMPEMLISKSPADYLDWQMACWTATRTLAPFDPRAMAHYRAFFSDPARIHATCEDYRAGESTDLAYDEVDHGNHNKIAVPMLALWGKAGIPDAAGPLNVWRQWAKEVSGKAIDSGHFLPEENPDATSAAMLEFFRP